MNDRVGNDQFTNGRRYINDQTHFYFCGSYTVLFSAIIEVFIIPILLFGPGEILASPIENKQISLDSQQHGCVKYNSAQKLIMIRCKSVKLTDIYNNLNDPTILSYEKSSNGSAVTNNGAKVWLLKSGILIEKDSSLIIDSTDTSWLKITTTPTMQLNYKQFDIDKPEADYSNGTVRLGRSDNESIQKQNSSNISKIEARTLVISKHYGSNPNGIDVHGSLRIDSVKITSWDAERNNVIEFDLAKRPADERTITDYDSAEPRAFIKVSKDATGKTNITNSEIAYLGYNASGRFGLSYYAGTGSMIKNNKIHHLWYGFYSANHGYEVYDISIENNYFFNNYRYGIDPHSGTHDLIIKNNTVYDNGKHGIICSKSCTNIRIEGNKVFSNIDRGIMLDKNITNSTIAGNIIYNNTAQVAIHTTSNSNKIKNNTVYGGDIGIEISDRSSNNIVSNNAISNTRYGIYILEPGAGNKFFYNTIKNATSCSIFIEDNRSCIRDSDNPISDSVSK